MYSEDIYAALTDDEVFAGLPQRLAELTGGRSAAIYWRHPCGDGEVFAHCYFSDEQIQAYVGRYAPQSPWHQAALKPGRINRLWHISEDVADRAVLASEVWNDWIRPNGDDTFYTIGGVFDTPWGRGSVGINRGRSQGEFEQVSVERLVQVGGHLQRMLAIRGELAARRRECGTLRATLDTLGYAALHVRADGRVLALNAAAEGLLRRADGLLLAAGRLTAQEAESAARLAAIVSAATRACDPGAGATRVLRRDGSVACHVTVTPLVGVSTPSRALVLLREPVPADTSLDRRLRALYDLSPAEAGIAVGLASGLTPRDVAVQRGVSEGTVRSQVKTLMAKLGVHRQAEVVALVVSLPPLRT